MVRQEVPGDELGAAVVVCHVEGVEPGVVYRLGADGTFIEAA
jgi:hypothetical protein